MSETSTPQIQSQSSPLRLLQRLFVWAAIIIISGNVGYRMGQKQPASATSANPSPRQSLINTAAPTGKEVDFTLFWDVWQRLDEKYVDKSKLDTQKMVDGAIAGMVSALGDPYTVYLPKKENEEFKQDLNGTFEGVGAQLGSKDDHIIVIAPLKDHPAEKAGVRAGDWIVKVNDEATAGWTVPQAVDKIRGPKGSVVKLTIVHDGEGDQQELSVMRDRIIVKSVEFELKSESASCVTDCKQVAVVRLSRFGDQTNDEWNTVVSQVKDLYVQKKISGIVLDLRNNPGGYLQSSIYVASEFIKSGVVVAQENGDGSKETYSVTRVGTLLDVPLTVLINKGSASAAEILSGALRDYARAKLIGETSFGKGTIQTPEELPGGAGIHITTARWILPKGDQISGKGIKPDFEVKYATGSAAVDNQLDAAIEKLLQ